MADGGLRVSRLRFAYGEEPIVNGLDHHFDAGRLTAVTGESGSGKSTLLYLLGLLLAPDAGRIEISGRSVGDLPDPERCRIRANTIGFVFQDAALDPTRTVLENVTSGVLYAGTNHREAERSARRLLNQLGVRLRADHRPGEISGGQAQRVALCRALIKRPHLLLADEPTGNLDADSARVVLDATAEVAATGATVVIASHDPTVVAACDDVLRM